MGSKAILLLGYCLAVLLLIASDVSVTAMDFVEIPISNEKTVQEKGVDDAKYGGGEYPGGGYGGYPSGGYVGNRGGEHGGNRGSGAGGHGDNRGGDHGGNRGGRIHGRGRGHDRRRRHEGDHGYWPTDP